MAPRLDAAVARAGAGYTALQIRGQRTRWASCSSTGAMSFNWRLLLAPPEILDYVVEHEVAHLACSTTPQRFWVAAGRAVPDWREHERWLRAPRARAAPLGRTSVRSRPSLAASSKDVHQLQRK